MISEGHPYYFLAPLLKHEGATFHLSKYVYVSDSLLDERELIKIKSYLLTEQWLNSLLRSLESEQELALHSNVTIGGKTYHIPMIDFSIRNLSDVSAISRMRKFLPRKIMTNMGIFNSGRSFHAYANTLLPAKEWIEFMGRLLLINKPDIPNIIDSRWIGHRLIGGYCSLRWSNNSKMYLGIPRQLSVNSWAQL